MKKNKNFTLYWIVIAGAVLTVPIAFIIMKKFTESSNFSKAFLITLVFLIITGAIAILYRQIFGVTMEEIAQNNKVTELDRKQFWLQSYIRKHGNTSNSMQQILIFSNNVILQIENFERRKEVYLELLDAEQREKGNALSELANTVENALIYNIEKIINRITIFDDKVQPAIVNQNLEYIDKFVKRNEEVLINFEKLIAEVSSMGDASQEEDVSKLTDIIKAMESIRTEKDDDMDELLKKYE